jgi:hypothetical protein
MQVKLVMRFEGLRFPRPHSTLDPRQGHLAPVLIIYLAILGA